MWRTAGLWLVLTSGCDRVLGLEPPPDFQFCDRRDYDPMRYRLVPEGMDRGMTFLEARDRCVRTGMDLLQLDDAAERIALGPQIAVWAESGSFWIGATDEAIEDVWVGVDDCPLELSFTVGEPSGGRTENCAGILYDGRLVDGKCTDFFHNDTSMKFAACETPRWPTDACLLRAMSHATPHLDPTPRSFDDAQAYCRQRGEHLIEINSSAELETAKTIAGGRELWLGMQFDSTRWRSATGCPGLAPWESDQPQVASTGDCVTVLTTAKSAACGEIRAVALCEPNE